MSTRSGRVRQSITDTSPSRVRKGISPPRSPARSRKSSPPARTPRKSPSRKSPGRKPGSSPKYPARKSPSRVTKETVEEADPAIPRSPAKRPAIKTSAVVKLEDVSAKYEIYRSTRSKRIDIFDSVKDYPSTLISSETATIGEKLNGAGLDNDASTFGNIYDLRKRRSVEDASPRRRSKLRELVDSVPDIRRSFSKSLSKSLSQSASESISKSVSKSVDTLSDRENSEDDIVRQKEKSRSTTRKLATPLPNMDSLVLTSKYEFGGRVGSTALIILIPLTVLVILVLCTKSCSHKLILDLSIYHTFTKNITKAIILILLQFVIQAVFVVIPIFGKTVDKVDEAGRKFCFNAFFVTLFTTSLLFAIDFYGILNTNTILSLYVELASVSYILGVILALVAYVKSQRVDDNHLNPYGNSGYTVYDFFMGREICPDIKKLNIKLWLFRISNITALILTILIFKYGIVFPEKALQNLSLENYKELFARMQFKPTILLFSMMQLTYILIFIRKEYQITTTFYWQSEGAGYLQIVSSVLYPFYFTTISKNIADTDLVLPRNVLIAAFVLYTLGFLLMFLSNNIKYEFRRYPLDPRIARLNSMPTFLGKKLLVGDLWGILRHPNYTGDIMIHISLAIPGILSNQFIASAPALITIVVLLHRAWRDHARCKRRYGAAWHRYCKRVPSAIIPKIL